MSIKINFKTVTGTLYTLSVDPNITIADCKKLLMEQHLHESVTITMVYIGHILKDSQTIQSCNIGNESTVILSLKKRPAIAPAIAPAPSTPTIPVSASIQGTMPITTPNAPEPLTTPTQDDLRSRTFNSLFDNAEESENLYQYMPELSQTDIDNLTQLKGMGFNVMECLQTYFACDQNLEMAINLLLN